MIDDQAVAAIQLDRPRRAAGEVVARCHLGMPVVERAPRIGERDGWQEAFLCGTLTGCQPLALLDRKAIGLETVGEWTKALALALERFEEEVLRS